MPENIILGTNQYGKSEVHMVTVERDGDLHRITDVMVSITLSGDLADVHTSGDNANIVATDTQKNTVFAFAKQQPVGAIEDFALRLGRHFVSEFKPITRARVKIQAFPWNRLSVGGEPHDHAFSSGGAEERVTSVVCETSGDGIAEYVVSGVQGLVLLKSTGSEFTGYIKDRYTTLPETTDRILATSVSARWRHSTSSGVDWDDSFQKARTVMIETFAQTHSLSLQQTLYKMAGAIIDSSLEIVEARFSLPNRHHFVADLTPFGLENPNEVFRVEDRPYGLIEAIVLAQDAPAAGPAWDPYPIVS